MIKSRLKYGYFFLLYCVIILEKLFIKLGGKLMISAGDFRKGTTFEMDGDVYQIIDFQHAKPGKGAAFVRTKIKSVKVVDLEKWLLIQMINLKWLKLKLKEMQYLYSDGELYYFMDTETYEQLPLNFDVVEEALLYLREMIMQL